MTLETGQILHGTGAQMRHPIPPFRAERSKDEAPCIQENGP